MELEFAAQHQCVCCGGVIDGLADDGAVGVDARIGLFSDECVFVCNDCTTSLIEASARRRQEAARRR